MCSLTPVCELGATKEGQNPEEGIMYPIEREDSVNAYIGAMTEEIRQSRLSNKVEADTKGAVDRLYRTVADNLRSWHHGTRGTTAPLSTA